MQILNPVDCLVCFFQGNIQLVDEVCRTLCISALRNVSSNTGATPEYLF